MNQTAMRWWWWSDNQRRDRPDEHQQLLQQRTQSSVGDDTYGADHTEIVEAQYEELVVVAPTDDSNSCDVSTMATIPQQVPTTLSFFHMVALLSTAFAYGCIFTTLFVITLPIECERIQQQQQQQQQQSQVEHDMITSSTHSTLLFSKSTLLGIFVAIAGLTQLISPFIGYMSDSYVPPKLTQHTDTGTSSVDLDHPSTTSNTSTPTTPTNSSSQNSSSSPSSQSYPQQYAELGQRLPYYIVGAMFATTGLIGQMFTSYSAWWIHYSFAFIFSMIGLNIQYAMMLALLPDQISSEQIGIANGILAFLLVTGSIFGFTLFHVLLYQDSIQSMYGLYASIVILTSILTSLYAHDRDAEISALRLQRVHEHCQQSLLILGKESNDTPPTDNGSKNDTNCHFSNHSVNRRTSVWHVQAGVATHKIVRGAVQKAQQMVVTPTIILRSMIAPIHRLNYYTLIQCYTIDIHTNHNFLIVTLSRLFYYCGMSIQTFFLYYIHDIIQIPPHENPETIVAILAMIGQCSGALTCYPVGLVSDRLLHGQRKPFIYVACVILAAATFSFVYARTVHHMIIICTILGAANGMYLTAETSLAVDTLTTETKTNHQNDHETATVNERDKTGMIHGAGTAQLLGIWGVAAFVGSALGPLIGGPLLEAFGTTTITSINTDVSSMHHHKTNTVPDGATSTMSYTITGYTVILSLSSFYFVCSAVILLYIKVNKEVNNDSNVSEERK